MDKVYTNEPYSNITNEKQMDNSLAKGIDVSIVQGMGIDFNAVAASGIEFVIAKCGSGNDGIDSAYIHNINGAKNAGLKVGSYNFVYPLPTDPNHPNRDPVGQAQLHFSRCITNLVIMDYEWPSPESWNAWGISAQFINDWGLQYLEEYTRLSGRKPLVYTYPDFCNHVKPTDDYANYDLWIASYVPNQPVIPHPWSDWIIWQTGGGNLGHLPNGAPVDTNLAKDLSIFD